MTDNARVLAFAFAGAYIVAGLAGFLVTGFDDFAANTNEALLIFEVNPFHNIVHIGVGGLWILAAMLPSVAGTEGVHIGIGLVYVLATVLGVLGFLEVLSIDGALAPDNFLHAASGAAALAVGLASARSTSRAQVA